MEASDLQYRSDHCEVFNNAEALIFKKYYAEFNKEVNVYLRIMEINSVIVIKLYLNAKLNNDRRTYLTNAYKINCDLKEMLFTTFTNAPKVTTVDITSDKLRAIPKGIFTSTLTPQLEVLTISRSKINSIEHKSFNNISKLKKIKLNNNKLEVWMREWFENTTLLEIIDVSFNSIREIPSKAFSNFSNLKKIHFDHNYITVIQINAFEGVTNLVYLGFSHNNLKALSDISFPNSIKISYFAINANHLTYISDKTLKKLTIDEITMDFNPWTCQCLNRIHYWLYMKNVKVIVLEECNLSQVPICVVPKNTEDCLDQFDREVLTRYVNTIQNINKSIELPSSCINFN